MRRFFVSSCAVLAATACLISLAQAETANNKTTKAGKNRERGVVSNPATKGAAKQLKPGEAQSLSPQPLPPGEAHGRVSPGEKGALSPQPLPPREAIGHSGSPGEKNSLSPQPLPPREGGGAAVQ